MGSLRRLLRSRIWDAILFALIGAGVIGCRTYDPPPLENASCSAQECYPAVEATKAGSLAATLAANSQAPPICSRPLNVLSLSGGVEGAPFTAGALVGWSQTGTRPMFDVVNGISSGSLIGGYAFLGAKYDADMRDLILNLKTSDLFKFRPIRCIFRDGSFGSARPAKRLIRKAYHDAFLDDVRQAHAEGRRFFIGTMNMQTKRLTTWDIGAIASSGRPDANELVRKVLLAAVSWPGAFPPVEFDVEVNGRCYHEMHCDAGAVAMAMVRFGAMPGWSGCRSAARPGWLAGSNLYVLTSRKLYSDPAPVSGLAVCRLGLSFAAIFEALTRADISRLYTFCAAAGMHFHLLAVPQDYCGKPPSIKCMYPKDAPRLFEVGYQIGASGPHWRHSPPYAELGEEAIPRDGSHIVK